MDSTENENAQALERADVAELAKRFRARLLTNALLPSAALIVWIFGLLEFSLPTVLGLGASLLTLNILYLTQIDWILRRNLLTVTYLTDVFVVTAILHFIGGTNLPALTVIYVLVVLRSARTRARATPFIVANVAALAYGALVFLEWKDWVANIESVPGFSSPPAVKALSVGFAALFLN
ncbi:MAG: hypothetical protein ACRD1Z_08175, partial [Vicinamibacteria bacterium]